MHHTEPPRPRPGTITTFAGDSRTTPAAGRNSTYGPSFGLRQHAENSSRHPASHSDAALYTMDTESKGCVPTHRSVFRLFKRKTSASQRAHSGTAQPSSHGSGVPNTSTDTRTSSSTASDSGGYMRSRKNTREMTLSAQRTRSELAVEGPRLLNATASASSGIGKQTKATLATSGSRPLSRTKLQEEQQQQQQKQKQYQQRTYKADKGTIVQLRSSQEKRIVIPSIDDIHAAALAAESDARSSDVAATADSRSKAADSVPIIASPRADAFDADVEADDDDDGDDDIVVHEAVARSPAASGSSKASTVSSLRSRQRGAPRKSASASDMAKLLKDIEDEVDQQTVSEDEVLTTTAKVAVHVLPDDSSDWNSDFSSPTSWRRPAERTPSRLVARVFEGSSRLKDRAIDRGVLEAQHRILQQEKYLLQISNLSSALARLRPMILRCLVFELPDRGIQIGTSTFVSSIREPCGSIEPSVEEERLWELWRQAEALLTIMDNDSMPLTMLESRLTLSKKRAIMLAFCDWEQYSLYVQDAWDKARKGIEQPSTPDDMRRSRSNSINTSSGPASANAGDGAPRESFESGRASSGFLTPGSNRLARFSLSRQRKSRRRSVVGVAPASLQRIADEAQAVREECEQLLCLMSPLYRENSLSPQSSSNALSTSDTAAAIAAAAAATEAASAEIDAMAASSVAQSPSMFSVKSCPNC
ncbi:hypothetical protein H4S06_001563 [Coemansia sp. BCRC 34490]|nr:hypothetical protein H4S06_001563 [Coemansia sp. BCRC 34490]